MDPWLTQIQCQAMNLVWCLWSNLLQEDLSRGIQKCCPWGNWRIKWEGIFYCSCTLVRNQKLMNLVIPWVKQFITTIRNISSLTEDKYLAKSNKFLYLKKSHSILDWCLWPSHPPKNRTKYYCWCNRHPCSNFICWAITRSLFVWKKIIK